MRRALTRLALGGLVLVAPARGGTDRCEAVASRTAARARTSEGEELIYWRALHLCEQERQLSELRPPIVPPQAPTVVELPGGTPAGAGHPAADIQLLVLSRNAWHYADAVLVPGSSEARRICDEISGLLTGQAPFDLVLAVSGASEERTEARDGECEMWRACTRARMTGLVVRETRSDVDIQLLAWNLGWHDGKGVRAPCGGTDQRGGCTEYQRPRFLVGVRNPHPGTAGALTTAAAVIEEYWRRCREPDAPAPCVPYWRYAHAESTARGIDESCGPQPPSCRPEDRQPPIPSGPLCSL